MPSRPTRPAAFAWPVVLGLAMVAAPPAFAGPATIGDPDIPATLRLDAGPSRSFLSRDLDRLASSRTLRVLAVGGALALAVHGDENPDRTERALDQPALDGSVDAGSTYGHGAVLGAGALGLLAAGALADDANLRGAGSEVLRSLAYTGITVTVLKHAVARTRPDGGAWSFPSGHTAAAFAVAPVLAERFGTKVGVPAYALAVATGLGRMEDRRHWLSDVLAGAAIGVAIGEAVAADGRTSHAPHVDLTARGLELSTRF